jgi:hypothetical protein
VISRFIEDRFYRGGNMESDRQQPSYGSAVVRSCSFCKLSQNRALVPKCAASDSAVSVVIRRRPLTISARRYPGMSRVRAKETIEPPIWAMQSARTAPGGCAGRLTARAGDNRVRPSRLQLIEIPGLTRLSIADIGRFCSRTLSSRSGLHKTRFQIFLSTNDE